MNSLVAATTILVNLSVVTQKIAQMIQGAQMQDRDLSDEEMKKINDSYADSFIALNEAIRRKGGK